IRTLASKVINSTTKLQPVWKQACVDTGLKVKFLPRDAYDMLEAAVKYREVVTSMCAKAENGLRDYELTQEEWELAKQLGKVLKDGTLFFSRGSPNLAKVIPAMDHIDKHLATASISNTYVPAIRAACKLAKIVLNKYYSLTDASKLYRLAMSKYSFVSDMRTLCLLRVSSAL
ncbi:hypothetical protein C8T65DRAFT_592372, partial [Cerioporus squamosus]